MKNSFLFLVVIFLCYSCSSKKINEDIGTFQSDCDGILISPIQDQKVCSGTRSYVFLSAVANDLSKLEIKKKKGPKYVSIVKTKEGRAVIIIDAPENFSENDIVVVEVNDGTQFGCIEFGLNVYNNSNPRIYVDPNFRAESDGSKTNPYRSWKQLVSEKKIGHKDVVIFKNGAYGDVIFEGSNYNIFGMVGHTPKFSSIKVIDGHHIDISGLTISSLSTFRDKTYAVIIDSKCTHIGFHNNIVQSIENADEWDKMKWKSNATKGIKVQGSHIVIEQNLFRNVFHGIKIEGDKNIINYNHVDRFSGDAIRNIGSYNQFNYNFLTNATIDDYYDKDGNHDDLFQSWTFDAPLKDIRLSHNIMISCLDTKMPLRSKIVQGLVCFDGFEKDWVVDHNLVVTDHPHGIALFGADNCVISNNTVLRNPHRLFDFEAEPWIMINDHKDGRQSITTTVNNNITTHLNIISKDVNLSNNTILNTQSINKMNNYYERTFRVQK
ncbi:MAG: hypothetical protein V3V14_12470 [Saprospiraceae bacterium]